MAFLVVREKQQWAHVREAVDISNMSAKQVDREEVRLISNHSAANEFEDHFSINIENDHPKDEFDRPVKLS